MNCSDCRFFKPRDKGDWGSCRRYPPMGPDSMWPGVAAGSWCGEHRYATGVSEVKPGVTAESMRREYDAGLLPLPPVELLDDMDAMGMKYDPRLRPADLPPAKGKKA